MINKIIFNLFKDVIDNDEIELFIDSGLDNIISDEYDTTPLKYAKLLIMQGTNINTCDHHGIDVALTLIQYRNIDIIIYPL